LTDYISEADIERELIGNKLSTFLDNNVDKNSIDVLLIWHFLANEESLKDFPNLKAIVRYGVGYDNIDLNYCKENDIKVFNNPDYGVDEVSDTALAMILHFSRCLGHYNNKSRELVLNPNTSHPWQENINQNALRLKDLTLGLVGVGRIGSALALKMKNIIGEVHFYDPYVVAGYEKVLGASRHNSLNDLLNVSDIVSIHTPLEENTKGMINEDFVTSMKYGSIIINTARGGLLSSYDCLFDGLISGRIGAVGLDVLPEEPAILSKKDDFILSWLDVYSDLYDRIIINPHTAYYSPESYKEMRIKASKMSLNALEDIQIQNRIV
jgi:lactate dehydrogenase-like 2-hydroxyacid dehydrogenase